MIVSYETLRTLQDELAGAPIGLLLADEGHRLKNAGKLVALRSFLMMKCLADRADTLTFQSLTALNVQRRVILTGTPIQNDLSEYFALLSFANPEYLGSKGDFKKNFENKILRGRDADASEKDKLESDAKLKELGGLVSKFIIRRTNDLLSKYRELLIFYQVMINVDPQSPSNTNMSSSVDHPLSKQSYITYSSLPKMFSDYYEEKILNHSRLLDFFENSSIILICSTSLKIFLVVRMSCRMIIMGMGGIEL